MTMLPLSSAPRETLAGITAVLTDIDDTLTLHGQLPAEAFSALWALKHAGLKVIPITGRPAGWCDAGRDQCSSGHARQGGRAE